MAICGDHVLQPEQEVSKDSVSNWQRSNYITKFYRSSNAIIEQKRAFPNVQYRHLFLEKDPLGNLDFRNQTTWPYQMQGREDAHKVIENTSFDGFKSLAYFALTTYFKFLSQFNFDYVKRAATPIQCAGSAENYSHSKPLRRMR